MGPSKHLMREKDKAKAEPLRLSKGYHSGPPLSFLAESSADNTEYAIPDMKPGSISNSYGALLIGRRSRKCAPVRGIRVRSQRTVHTGTGLSPLGRSLRGLPSFHVLDGLA